MRGKMGTVVPKKGTTVHFEPGIFTEPHFWLRGWAFPLSEPARAAGWWQR
jgi:hypothetical protein